MPHCILEYSSNVIDPPEMRRVLLEINSALAQTGLFKLEDIKSRGIKHRDFVVGDGNPNRAFVTLNIQIFSGRSDEAKAQVSQAAFHVLQTAFSKSLEQQNCSITVQVTDIHRPSYRRNLSTKT